MWPSVGFASSALWHKKVIDRLNWWGDTRLMRHIYTYHPACLTALVRLQAAGAAFQEIPEVGSAIVWEQQRDRLMKHLSRAQTRAALRRVCVTIFKCFEMLAANFSKMWHSECC